MIIKETKQNILWTAGAVAAIIALVGIAVRIGIG